MDLSTNSCQLLSELLNCQKWNKPEMMKVFLQSKSCASVLQTTRFKGHNFYFQVEWSPFPVGITLYEVIQPLS